MDSGPRILAAALFSAAALSAALPCAPAASNSVRPAAAIASSFSSAQHPLLLRLAGGGLRPRDDVKRMNPVEAAPPFQSGNEGSSIDSEEVMPRTQRMMVNRGDGIHSDDDEVTIEEAIGINPSGRPKELEREEGPDARLWDASFAGDLEGVMAAMAEGADFDSKDISHDQAWTAVHFAASGGQAASASGSGPCVGGSGHCQVLTFLKKSGADLDEEDLDFKTPLRIAADRGKDDIVSLLLGFGVRASSADVSGATPLHAAAAQGAVACVIALLDGGADPTERDFLARTPYDVAMQGGEKTRGAAEILEGRRGEARPRSPSVDLEAEPDDGIQLSAKMKELMGDDADWGSMGGGKGWGGNGNGEWSAKGDFREDEQAGYVYNEDEKDERLKEIEASIQAGMVGGNLGDAEGLTDDAEIEGAMAKEWEERGRKFASNYKSLQEKFPYVAPKPPAGYSLEEMESLTSKPRSKPGSVVSGSVAGSELRRCGEDIDKMLQPVTEELAEITRRERSAMDAILGGDQGADGDDDGGVVEELGTCEEEGKRYGWTRKGVMVELGDDGGSQATLAGEGGENGGEGVGDR